MRAVVAIAVALASVIGGVHAAPGDQAQGFDHVAHDGKINVTGQTGPPCSDCHALDRKGRVKGAPGHAACFGACHGAPPARPRAGRAPAPIPAGQQALCATCHAPSALAALAAGQVRTVVAAYPPYAIDRDFELALSHAGHDPVAPCRTCHGAEGRPAGGTGHDRCASCHLAPAAATATPALSQCSACHVAAYGPARGPALTTGPLAVGASFSHQAHRKQAGGGDCRSCHGAVSSAPGRDLPGPTTADCRGCHDGATAFSTTEACTRCHTAEPTTSYQLDAPDRAFSHQRHRARLPAGACTTCHTLDRRGEAISPGHASCADAGCHQADFASTTPTICGACHVAIEPWRRLRADALPRPETEFGARMPHRRHRELGRTCGDCHALDTGRRERRPPRGHASCTGASCHVAAGGPRPALGDCDACHQAGLVSARILERLAAAWTVRARFTHDAHRRDADGAEVPCGRCHDGVWDVDNLPPTPSKPTCAGCHDGKLAFKMTGHGCARCHGENRARGVR